MSFATRSLFASSQQDAVQSVDNNLSRSHDKVSLVNVGVAALIAIGSIGTLCGLSPILIALLSAARTLTAVWVAIAVHRLGVSSAIEKAELTDAAASAEARAKGADEKAKALERRHAPRQLSAGQQERLLHKLTEFAGQQSVVFMTTEPEPSRFGVVLTGVLHAAGWAVAPQQGTIAGRIVCDVIIEYGPNPTHNVTTAAHALAQSLRAEGIAVMGADVSPSPGTPCLFIEGTVKHVDPATVVAVLIGPKEAT
jgi:hypothetical protein